MKHLYIALAAALLAGQVAEATPQLPQRKRVERRTVSASVSKRTKAAPQARLVGESGQDAKSMDWGYGEDPYTAYAMGAGLTKEAIMIPKATLGELSGNSITGVAVGTPPDASTLDPSTYEYDNPVKDCTVWLSYGLDEEPFASASGKLDDWRSNGRP